MKAKAKPARAVPANRRRSGAAWRMGDLSPELQAELKQGLAEAKQGKDLVDGEHALDDAEKMADEIAGILHRSEARRPG